MGGGGDDPADAFLVIGSHPTPLAARAFFEMPGTKKERREHRKFKKGFRLKRTESGVVAGPKYNRRGGNPDMLNDIRQLDIYRSLPRSIPTEDGEFRPKPRTFFNCLHCQKEVDCLPYEIGLRVFCSVTCHRSHVRQHGKLRPDGTRWTTKARKRYKTYKTPIPYRMAKWLRELRDPTLTPAQAARLRGQIASGMDLMIQEAEDVVFGRKSWTPTQARVFGLLMGKVLPDLSASHVISERRNVKPEEMTIEELEQLLATNRELSLPDTPGLIIDATPKDAPHGPQDD